jgi:Spy/CpxP family protein refolding chaperone
MKRTLLLLTLGALLTCPSLVKAQDDSTNTPPAGAPPGGHHHDMGMGILTDAEKQELKAAHDKAITDDPSLKTDEDALKASHQPGTPPTDDQKAKWMAFREKMNKAMIAADPNVAPILAKLEAGHHRHHDADGGTPTPPPSNN